MTPVPITFTIPNEQSKLPIWQSWTEKKTLEIECLVSPSTSIMDGFTRDQIRLDIPKLFEGEDLYRARFDFQGKKYEVSRENIGYTATGVGSKYNRQVLAEEVI